MELQLAVAVLAVIAAVVIPATRPADHERLRLAAGLAADACRFARDQASRTGTVHGVFVDAANDRLRVFRLDEAPNPNVAHFDVRHPVSKQPYTVSFGSAALRGISVQNQTGTATGPCADTAYLGFDPSGATLCIEPTTTRLEAVSLTLVHDGMTKVVQVDSYTGRTTVP